MICFDRVGFRYGRAEILRNLSFTLKKGEFAALVGANGAGKSTLCRLCNGLLKPSAGSVTVGGRDTRRVKTSELARTVGFLFQNPDRQICQNTVREEIRFGLRCILGDRPETAAEIDGRCEETLAAFGLDGAHDPFSMSRGERQQVAIASLVACRPEVLILDEPTTGLDYRECTRVMELMRALNRAGTTILMISHDMEVVSDFARRVLVLSGGELAGDGPVREILSDEALLRGACVLPPQIPALAARLGEDFDGVFTVGEMCDTVCSLACAAPGRVAAGAEGGRL